MNLFDSESQQNHTNPSLNSTTDRSKALMQEMSEQLKIVSQELAELKKMGRPKDQDLIQKLSLELLEMKRTLRDYVCLNQDLSKVNQNLQEELQKVLTEMSDITNLNQQLSRENDSLRNRGGLMLRDQQERLEERIADVQAQNSKLRDLVNLSNVDTVKAAIKERDAVRDRAAQEIQKSVVAKKNADKEIAKAKRNAKSMIADAKRKVRLWQMVAVGTLILGLAMGWML